MYSTPLLNNFISYVSTDIHQLLVGISLSPELNIVTTLAILELLGKIPTHTFVYNV